MKESTEGQNEIITPPDSAPQAPFDLRIRFDAAHRVIAISLNDEPLNLTPPAPPIEPPLGHPHAAGPSVAVNSNPDPAMCLERGSAERTGQRVLFHLTRNSGTTLLALWLLQFAAFRTVIVDRDAFLDRYGWWILYLDLSVVALVATLRYLRCYVYAQASHMVGMLIGMTIGMQVGTMIGGVLGATNGFFVGSIVGMSLGSLYGVVTAWRCGPMAVCTV